MGPPHRRPELAQPADAATEFLDVDSAAIDDHRSRNSLIRPRFPLL
jgi:hypothetical protein